MAVTSIEIKERGPYAEGMTFGDTGAYEQLDGTVYFAVDPADPANSLITDLELAPRNAAGLAGHLADQGIECAVEHCPRNGHVALFGFS